MLTSPRGTNALNRIVLHVPLHARIDGDFRTVVHVGKNELSLHSLEMLEAFYRDRLHRVVFERLPEDTALFESESKIIFVVPITLDELLCKKPRFEKWRRARVLFELTPSNTMVRLANHLTAEGFPVRIPVATCMDAHEAAGRCLDLYLHNRSLSVPVDPFHSLFAAACAERNITFGKIDSEAPEQDLFVAEDGRMGPSAVLLHRGFQYAAPGESIETALQSSTRARLLDTVSNPKNFHVPCGECAIQGICRGFLALHGKVTHCEAWRAAVQTIATGALSVRSIVAELKATGRADG